MTTPTLKRYQSAPLENNDLEQRLGKNYEMKKSFNISINIFKEMITCFKDDNHNSKKNY